MFSGSRNVYEKGFGDGGTVSMKGHGAETASGYSLLGGSREYKEAMRKSNAALKRAISQNI